MSETIKPFLRVVPTATTGSTQTAWTIKMAFQRSAQAFDNVIQRIYNQSAAHRQDAPKAKALQSTNSYIIDIVKDKIEGIAQKVSKLEQAIPQGTIQDSQEHFNALRKELNTLKISTLKTSAESLKKAEICHKDAQHEVQILTTIRKQSALHSRLSVAFFDAECILGRLGRLYTNREIQANKTPSHSYTHKDYESRIASNLDALMTALKAGGSNTPLAQSKILEIAHEAELLWGTLDNQLSHLNELYDNNRVTKQSPHNEEWTNALTAEHEALQSAFQRELYIWITLATQYADRIEQKRDIADNRSNPIDSTLNTLDKIQEALSAYENRDKSIQPQQHDNVFE